MRAVAALLVVAAGSRPAPAADFFVAPTGSDEAGDGSAARPWMTLDFAAARVPADAGHTIRLTAGTHVLSAIARVPSGVSVVGEGKSKTVVECRHFFDFDGTKKPKGADWLPDPWDYDPSAEKSAILQLDGMDQTLRGFTLDGQGKKCVVGVLVHKGRNLRFDDLAFNQFKIAGLWLHEVYDTEVSNCTFRNNSWGNKNQAFGALQFNRADRLSIHDNDISERGSGCYGIKMASKRVGAGMYSDNATWQTKTLNDDIRIYNNRFDVDEFGTWSTADGGGKAPAIAVEFNSDIEARNVDIHHNWLNNHLSIVSWETGQATGYHIHHNTFDLRSDDKKHPRYAYMVEANESNFEIDHNVVLGGFYPIASWHGDKDRNANHSVHHNVFYAPAGGQPVFRDGSGHDGYRFVNNTVIDTHGAKPIFLVERADRANRNAEVKNNLFVSTKPNRGDVLGDANALGGAAVSHNLFWNIAPRGEKALVADPLLDLDGLTFALKAGSPAIGAGVAVPGVTEPGVTAPDLGAFAFGRPAWAAGIEKSTNK